MYIHNQFKKYRFDTNCMRHMSNSKYNSCPFIKKHTHIPNQSPLNWRPYTLTHFNDTPTPLRFFPATSSFLIQTISFAHRHPKNPAKAQRALRRWMDFLLWGPRPLLSRQLPTWRFDIYSWAHIYSAKRARKEKLSLLNGQVRVKGKT